jgi:hypothetical protein
MRNEPFKVLTSSRLTNTNSVACVKATASKVASKY